jgi:hypothetical protein
MVQGTFGLAAGADTILVARRGRGEADATLQATGRDISEQELALRFSSEARTWAILGDAAEYALGETRKELLDAVRAHGSLTPKQVAAVTGIRRDLLVAVDNARVAAAYVADLDTLASVASEIQDAAGELVKALRPMPAVR